MIRINQIKMPLDCDEKMLKTAAARLLKCSANSIRALNVVRRSVDSRKKDNVFFVYNIDVDAGSDESAILSRCSSANAVLLEEVPQEEFEVLRKSSLRPVVVGFGPAGIFAALTLASNGLRPIVLERGADVDARAAAVNRFWNSRTLDENSNVQFGEGGAGTFSDGKLTTGIKDPLCRRVFEEFAECGAPQDILWSATPHIGTDKLGEVVKTLRKKIIALGGEVRFNCRLTGVIVANGVIYGVEYEENGISREIETDAVILSVGHSARDTVEMLCGKGIQMLQKPFSVGARIEHPRELIDKAQYGSFASHPALGAADYKLSCHPEHGRGAYTFCMCPGGTVVAAASEAGGVVVNGMSEYARNGENSNSALLVGIEPADFPDEHPLAGMRLQREIEKAAFALGGGDYHAPAQLVGDFLKGEPSVKLGGVRPSCPTGVTPSDIRQVLPKKVTDTMADAIVKMDRQLHGFALPQAVLTAPETRSSSPVRIVRNEFYQSVSLPGLYPCGEGAGYAGGIVSAAVDGIRCAAALMKDERDS